MLQRVCPNLTSVSIFKWTCSGFSFVVATMLGHEHLPQSGEYPRYGGLWDHYLQVSFLDVCNRMKEYPNQKPSPVPGGRFRQCMEKHMNPAKVEAFEVFDAKTWIMIMKHRGPILMVSILKWGIAAYSELHVLFFLTSCNAVAPDLNEREFYGKMRFAARVAEDWSRNKFIFTSKFGLDFIRN